MVMLETVKTMIMKMVYPVGSVYINATDSTNPGTLLGFGTWSAFAAGRVPVGRATSGTFATGGSTGGAETVSASHTHNQGSLKAAIGACNDNVGNIGYQAGTAISGVSYTYSINGTPSSISNINHATPVYGSTGSGGSSTQANLQPYVVVYMWRRTA